MTMINPLFFGFATPDPDFSGFTVEEEDQLPGRPMEGQIEIDRFFDHLQLVITEVQKAFLGDGSSIFDELRQTDVSVLGSNAGQFLYENQHLIPEDLREKVVLVFWGTIYRNSDRVRFVRYLIWRDGRWTWVFACIDRGYWHATLRAVVLKRPA